MSASSAAMRSVMSASTPSRTSASLSTYQYWKTSISLVPDMTSSVDCAVIWS